MPCILLLYIYKFYSAMHVLVHECNDNLPKGTCTANRQRGFKDRHCTDKDCRRLPCFRKPALGLPCFLSQRSSC